MHFHPVSQRSDAPGVSPKPGAVKRWGDPERRTAPAVGAEGGWKARAHAALGACWPSSITKHRAARPTKSSPFILPGLFFGGSSEKNENKIVNPMERPREKE